jgi:hypothetical protein
LEDKSGLTTSREEVSTAGQPTPFPLETEHELEGMYNSDKKKVSDRSKNSGVDDKCGCLKEAGARTLAEANPLALSLEGLEGKGGEEFDGFGFTNFSNLGELTKEKVVGRARSGSFQGTETPKEVLFIPSPRLFH